MRAVPGGPNLRTPVCYAAIGGALARCRRADFRVVHLSIQRNHVHLLVEADDGDARTRGMRALGVAFARAINHATSRVGKLFAHRYHATAITSPRQMRNTLEYLFNNWRKHAEDRGSSAYLDRYSSALAFDGWECTFGPPSTSYEPLPVRPATTWLLRVGWRRHGTLDSRHRPASSERT